MRRTVIGLLLAASLAAPALAQWQGAPPHTGAPGNGEVRHDRHEVRQDRRELRDDHREIVQDRREVNGDDRRGDYGEARRDRQDLDRDRRDFRGDRQDFRHDRRDLNSDWRDGHRGPPPGNYHRPTPGGWDHGWRNDRRYDWQGWRAHNRGFYRMPRYYAPRGNGYGYGYRRFDVGIRIAPLFYAQRYWISDPYHYRLPPAYGPYRWVRYYDDVLLIDLRTGLVVDSINGFFW